MTTIRRLCCNDLLDITDLTIELDMPSLSFYMDSMAEFPEYCLVVESPGNRIKGFICAYNSGEGEENHCEIADLIHMNIAEMLVQALEEKADKIYNVYYVKIEVPLDHQQSLDLFKNMGYTSIKEKEYFDVVDGELTERTIFQKDLSAAHDR
ncbi:hypothetical protein MKW94_022709 [Papaver nudicaule]|uniref:N-acetyltransferase domain-containing protein n=1 Tax=Papaver nudicaule TaxID=74823 RepID=A0AA41SI40_PAPNU|nr:hypothetical protein [Papaver nudicaule]